MAENRSNYPAIAAKSFSANYPSLKPDQAVKAFGRRALEDWCKELDAAREAYRYTSDGKKR